jgi:hypothetical protein
MNRSFVDVKFPNNNIIKPFTNNFTYPFACAYKSNSVRALNRTKLPNKPKYVRKHEKIFIITGITMFALTLIVASVLYVLNRPKGHDVIYYDSVLYSRNGM